MTVKMRTDFYPLSIFLPLRGGVYHMAFIESSARVMTSALEYIKPIGIQVLRLVIDSYKHSHFNPISFDISSFNMPVANITRFQFLRATKSKSCFGKNMILRHTFFRSDYASKSLHLSWTCIASSTSSIIWNLLHIFGGPGITITSTASKP